MTLEALVKTYEKKAVALKKEPHALKWLIIELSGYTPTEFYLKQEELVTDDLVKRVEDGFNKYIYENIPVQHIVGFSYFFGYKFIVNKDVLIPRRETEELVDEILYIYDTYFNDETIDVLDLGTGSGAIAITLDLEAPNLNVDAIDVSTKALKVAISNQESLGSDVNFFESNWFSNVTKKYDIIVANPPYIPEDEYVDDIVRKEPDLALFGGFSGLEPYEIILNNAKSFLKDKALIAFEHSMYQKDNLKDLIVKYFKDAKIMQLKDMQGKDRMTFVGIGGVL